MITICFNGAWKQDRKTINTKDVKPIYKLPQTDILWNH